MFKERLISGIVLVIILIATVGYGGNVLFAAVGLISLIGMSELYKISKVQGRLPGIVGYVAAVCYYGLLFFDRREFLTMISVLFLFSILLFIYILIRQFVFLSIVHSFIILTAIILFVSGIQLFSVGILGQYLAKTYTEAKHRPIYIIKDYIDRED